MLELALAAFLASTDILYRPLRDDVDRTCYADLLDFKYTALYARLQVLISVLHEQALTDDVFAANGPELHYEWKLEVQSRREAWMWYALAREAAVDPNDPDITEPERIINSVLDVGYACSGHNYSKELYTRLAFAQSLRGMIGETNWAFRIMPDVLPQYSHPIGPLNIKPRDN